MHKNLPIFEKSARYAFFLLLLVFAGPPVGQAVAQEKTIPVIMPLTQYESAGPTKLISSSQILALSHTGGVIEVRLSTLNGNNWQDEVVLSAACSDCGIPNWIWGNANTTVVVETYDRTIERDRTWLLGQTESRSWQVLEITETLRGETRNYDFSILDDAIYYRSVYFDPPLSLLWRLTDTGWAFTNDFEFPVSTPDTFHQFAFAGTLDDFIYTSDYAGELYNYINTNGTWNRVTITLPDVVQQHRISRPILNGDTLLVNVPGQDITLPNQGAAHLLHRESSGVWSHEATIARQTTIAKGPYDPIVSTLLASDSMAIVEARAYERDGNGNWSQIAGLSGGWEAPNSQDDFDHIWGAFVEGDKLAWQGSVSAYRFTPASDLHFSAWVANPECTGLDATGVGSTGTTLCTVLPITPLVAVDDLESAPDNAEFTVLGADDNTSDSASFTINNGRGNFTQTRYDYANEKWTEDTFNFCQSVGVSSLENSDQCSVLEYATSSDTLFVYTNGAAATSEFLYQGNRDATGQLTWRQFENISTVHDIVIEDNIGLIVHNNSGVVLLQIIMQDVAGVWSTTHEFQLDKIGIYGSWDNEYSIDGGRIIIGDYARSKYHVLALTEAGKLYYETTITPPNVPGASYITSDLHGDTLIVGGSLGRGSDDNTSTTGPFEPAEAPGVVRIYRPNAFGDWREVQEINTNAPDHNLGQQVFLSDNYAVVGSLRSFVEGSFTYFQPNYHIYSKTDANGWVFKNKIEADLPARNCADCSFQQDVRWSARVIDQYLFLPKNTDGTASVFDMETELYVDLDDAVLDSGNDEFVDTADSIAEDDSPMSSGGGSPGAGFVIFLALLSMGSKFGRKAGTGGAPGKAQ